MKTIFSSSICRQSRPGPGRRRCPPEKLNRLTLGDKGLVLVVSDGMGGALAGDVAQPHGRRFSREDAARYEH
jgi:hypothetical protein